MHMTLEISQFSVVGEADPGFCGRLLVVGDQVTVGAVQEKSLALICPKEQSVHYISIRSKSD